MEGNKLPVNVNDAKRKTFFRNLAVVIIVFVVFFTLPSLCGAHEHDHDHDHHGHSHDQPASFKYSKQANEQLLREEHHDHHGHDHVHGHHDHGHDHGHGFKHSEGQSKDIPLGLSVTS